MSVDIASDSTRGVQTEIRLRRHSRLLPLKLCMMALFSGAFALTTNATVYHVSTSGNDINSGTELSPFRTVQKGANVAVAGDTVVMHEGTYREHVKPARGGTDENNRITYKAADNEIVWIKGSEQVKTWISEGGGVWRVELSDRTYFNGYNPYTTHVSGLFLDYGTETLLGNVYLNGNVYRQKQTLAEVQSTNQTWYTSTTRDVTTIWANFGVFNPNSELCEINVRETLFYPSLGGLNYITIDGINFAHAANNWAPPIESPQIGVITPRDCRSWIVENCVIEYARCVGISIGRHTATDVHDINNGYHIIRNNIIRKCGEAGVAGTMFNSFSLIENNLIEDINYSNEFGGPETAGIKFHHSVDIVIKGNCIRRVSGNAYAYGIWIDWGNQGTRLTGNVIFQTGSQAVYLEANFGPILIDNNVFIGKQVRSYGSEGVVFANNLFVNSGIRIDPLDNRNPSYFVPHSVTYIYPTVKPGEAYEKAYNNIFIGGANSFDGTGSSASNNLYLGGIGKIPLDGNGVVDSFNPGFSYTSSNELVSISFNLNDSAFGITCDPIHDGNIGAFNIVPTQGLENRDGSRIIVSNDFYGVGRNVSHPKVGPFEDIQSGLNRYFLYRGPSFNDIVQAPYTGTPAAIPGTIQAESYDVGGEGVAYHDTTAGNTGSTTYRIDDDVDTDFSVVGWIDSGEWLEYTVDVAETGPYRVALRASSGTGGGSLHIKFDGVNKTGLMLVPLTDDWNSYEVFSSDLSLEAGEHVMRVFVDGGGWNLDSITFIKNDGINHYTPVAISKSVTTVENTAKAIRLTGSDGDYDPLAYTIVNQPFHGTLSGVAPNVVYTPHSGFNGKDEFRFKVNDGTVDSAIATVSITTDSSEVVLIGEDNFDAAGVYLTKTNSGPKNTANLVWNTVDRASVMEPKIIDTSVQAGGMVATNSADINGFLESSKTDRFFGMYRGSARRLTYQFNIAGFKNLLLSMDWAASGVINIPNITVSNSIDGVVSASSMVIGESSTDWIETMEDGRPVTNSSSAKVTINGINAASLTDVFKNYQMEISGTGSVLTLTLSMGGSTGDQAYGLDNVKLYGTRVAPLGYYGWVDIYGLSVSNSLPANDPDGDGLNNFKEYVFGGNPATPDTGHIPTKALRTNGETTFFEVVYARRTTPNHGLIYRVETCSNLILNEWTTNGVIELPATGTINEQFEVVTNRVPMNNEIGFMRLWVNSYSGD